jgi:hypothetical protein
MTGRVIITVLLLAAIGGLSAAFALAVSGGLFRRHSRLHAAPWRGSLDERPRREAPRAIEPAPDTIDIERASQDRLMGRRPQTAGQAAGYWTANPQPVSPPHVNGRAAVEVTDDQDGKHARPRAYLVSAEPYCSQPGCGSRKHWTEDHQEPAPGSHAQQAINDDLRAAGFKVHDGNDDAVDSMIMRALNGPLAIQAAKP